MRGNLFLSRVSEDGKLTIPKEIRERTRIVGEVVQILFNTDSREVSIRPLYMRKKKKSLFLNLHVVIQDSTRSLLKLIQALHELEIKIVDMKGGSLNVDFTADWNIMIGIPSLQISNFYAKMAMLLNMPFLKDFQTKILKR